MDFELETRRILHNLDLIPFDEFSAECNDYMKSVLQVVYHTGKQAGLNEVVEQMREKDEKKWWKW